MNIVYLALGAPAGTIARCSSDIWVTNATGVRTAGTFAADIAGPSIIGLFLTLSVERGWSNALVILVAVGFLGWFTTFSTFTGQTYQLIESGEVGRRCSTSG